MEEIEENKQNINVNKLSKKKFEVKKWNAVALWAWGKKKELINLIKKLNFSFI